MTNDSERSANLRSLVISATFTAEPLAPYLEFWIAELGLPVQATFAPFNQVFQSLLAPNSLFAQNNSGVNVLLFRWSDLAAEGADLEANAADLKAALETFSGTSTRPLIVIETPSPAGFDEQRSAQVAQCRALLASITSSTLSLHEGTLAADVYQVEDLHDPEADRLGVVPYREPYFAALATYILRRVDQTLRAPLKVIAVDCDNTLWTGICGEDGPEGVQITPARRHLQEFLLKQRESGMLLTIASKNNEQDVWDTFHAHPDMPLRREHFTAYRIDWESKADNLRSLARELNVGLDSFVFLDDNPKEIAEMEQQDPDVVALQVPEQEDRIAHVLELAWPFDHGRLSKEDLERAESYRQQQERATLERQSLSFEEFLASLQLQLSIVPATSEQMPRVAQLFERTNQMNTTTIRHSEGDLRRMLSEGWQCWTATASDRFGSYGLVGVLLAQTRNDALYIDSILLSCRAFGRGIVHAMLRRAGEFAASASVPFVDIAFRESRKNKPAQQLVASLPAEVREQGEFRLYRVTSEWLRGFEYRPERIATVEGDDPEHAPSGRFRGYNRIAQEYPNAASIVAAVQEKKRGTVTRTTSEPLPGLETEIAAIWRELLHIDAVGRDDNFFDLGGHSLLAVQLLARMNDRLGVNLTLEVIYSGTLTVAELARTVELAQLSGLSPEEYAALLAEVESLSEEQVRELLAQEEGGQH